MTDLIAFLTSEEIMVVYAIAVFSAVLCFLIYIAQKTYAKRNQKQNTMELNRLVEEIAEREKQEASKVEAFAIEAEEEAPVLNTTSSVVEEAIPAIVPEVIVPEAVENAVDEMVLDTPEVEETSTIPVSKEEPVSEIQYESVEVEQSVAQKELEKLTEELMKAEEAPVNIELTEFEAEQEENAIISLDELLAKGDTLYEKNEVTQYQDEGNEPISLQDLEARMQQFKESVLETKEEVEPVVVEDVTKEEVKVETVEMTEPQIMQTSLNLETEETPEVTTASKAYQGGHTFKSSPVISPIYGIENKQTELELENTATLQKFDDEIRKTNEFVMTLKELQKNLD